MQATTKLQQRGASRCQAGGEQEATQGPLGAPTQSQAPQGVLMAQQEVLSVTVARKRQVLRPSAALLATQRCPTACHDSF